MDCPLKWTKFKLIIFLSVGYVCSQNIIPGSSPITTPQKEYRECVKESPNANNVSPTPQLLNTLLTIAAANGVLPDIFPKIQPLGIAAPEALASVQEVKTTEASPTQPATQLYQREPVIEATRQMIPAYTNNITPSQTPTHAQTRSAIPVQPIIISPGLNQATQKNKPFVSPISELRQTPPPDTFTHTNEEVKISSMLEQPKTNPVEVTSFLKSEPMNPNSIETTEKGQSFPINLQISIPAPNVEAPHITFINAAYPTPHTESVSSTQNNPPSYPNWFSYAYVPPNPPMEIIVKKKKSWLKDLLPLVIFSMFKERENCNDKCRCCSCNSRRKNIPVPFPIPIPINNPVINTGGSNLFSYREYKDDDDWDDDWIV